MTKLDLSQECKVISTSKVSAFNTPNNRINDRNHTIISKDSEKVFDKIQHHFLIKALNKLGTEGNFLNLIKDIFAEPTVKVL